MSSPDFLLIAIGCGAAIGTGIYYLHARKKMGVVDSSKSSVRKGLRTSACKKKGIPSTVVKTPVPAFGDRDRPSARKNVAWVSKRFPFGKTAAAIETLAILKAPSWLAWGTSRKAGW